MPTAQAVPPQEPGIRPARAVPYQLQATADVDLSSGKVKIHFVNAGKAAAVFQVRSGNDGDGPWTYTVGAGDDLSDSWNFRASRETAYDLTVYGPNGFMRAFKGSLAGHGKANVAVQTVYEPDHDAVTLAISNAGDRLDNLRIANAYAGGHTVQALAPGDSLTRRYVLDGSFGWYDLTLTVDSDRSFQQRFAGHLETGKDSASDPALSGS